MYIYGIIIPKIIAMNKKVFHLVFSYFFNIVVAVITMVFLIIVYANSSETTFQKPYNFAGILSGIFAAMAFGVASFTLYSQRKQYEEQKEANNTASIEQRIYYEQQLKTSKEALDDNRIVYEQQMNDEKRRRFESTFFNMLQFHQDIVNSLKITYGEFEIIDGVTTLDENKVSEGRETFEKVYNHVVVVKEDQEFLEKYPKIFQFSPYKVDDYYLTEFGVNRRDGEISVYKGLKSTLNIFGLEGYLRCKQVTGFDHYFRNLYRLIKYVHKADPKTISAKEKYEYIALVRGTLSRYELVLIYYNCLSSVGNRKFKPLVEQYSLLKNLREDLLTYTYLPDDPENEMEDYDRFFTLNKNDHTKYFFGAFYNAEERKEYKKQHGL